jgi:transposase
VLNEPNKIAESKSYMWCLARSGKQPIVFYRYYDNRSRNAARDILVDYGGIVIADAYKVYESLSSELGFTLAGCWAHARRRFWEAEKFGKKPGEKVGSNSASVALSFIRKLYEVETEVRGKEASLILEARQGRSTLILEEFHAWLKEKEAHILPKSPTGKAIQYTLREWEKLTQFLKDGRVAIDNNYIESHIKSFAVGRKNFLFAVVQAGAHASAGLYTLVESAKANGIEPFDYLNLIFKELPAAKTQEQLESLLPYNALQTYQLRPYSPK